MYMVKDKQKEKAKQWDYSTEKFNNLASMLEKNDIDPMLLREVVEERIKFERMR